MTDFVVKDPPEYNDKMRMLETTDPAHADTFNALFGQLINNDAFLAAQAKSESFTLTNVNGWKRALEFTGASLALSFYLSTNNARTSVSGVLNANINSTHRISQTSSQRGVNAHYVDKAAVQFAGDRTILYFHTTDNIESLKLVINGSYDQAFYQNVDVDAMADGVYIYDFKDDVGIVADRAIADGNGNNIAKMLNSKSNCLRITPPIGIDEQWLTLFAWPHIASFQCEIKAARFNVPHGGMLCDVILDLLTVTAGENWDAKWTQIGSYNASMIFRVVSENGWMRFECYGNAPYPVFEITWLRNDLGDITLVNEVSTNTGLQITSWSPEINVGIVAAKALTVDMTVFTRHQVVSTYNAATDAEIEAAINDAYDNANGTGYFEFILASNAPGLALSGGRWYFQGYKDSDVNYGWIEGKTYIIGDSKVKRVKDNGVWSDWFKESFATHAVAVQHIIKTESELESLIDYIYGSVSNDSVFETMLSVGTSDVSIAGGLWYLSGFKHNNDFGYYEVKKYGTGSDPRMQYKSRSKQNGTWGGWVTISS